MLRFAKKLGRSDGLLSLALILSLVRVDPDSYLGLSSIRRSNQLLNYITGDAWGYLQTDFHRQIIPEIPYFLSKNVELSLAEYQEELIADLNELGRYGVPETNRTYDTYLLNEVGNETDLPSTQTAERDGSVLPTESQTIEDRLLEEFLKSESFEESQEASDLTAEDVDLIEILWKQDVDLGVPRDVFSFSNPSTSSFEQNNSSVSEKELYENALLEKKKSEAMAKSFESSNSSTNIPEKAESPLPGSQYIIDDETGEYILQENVQEPADSAAASFNEALNSFKFDLEDFSEDKLTDSDFTLGTVEPNGQPAFDLDLGLYGDDPELKTDPRDREGDLGQEEVALDRLSEELEARLEEMMQALDRNPVEESSSSAIMEQRWNELSGLLQFSTPEVNPSGVAFGFDADLPPFQITNAVPERVNPLGINGSYPDPSLETTITLGSALSASLNVTNSTELLLQNADFTRMNANPALYYQANATEPQNGTEGYFPSILNDEDLRLMDLAVHDSPYAMRTGNAVNESVFNGDNSALPLDSATVGVNGDSASDSALSSMGSERVPSISESDWIDTNASDSNVEAAHSSISYSVDYPTGGKVGAYGFAFLSSGSDASPASSGVQKKHQMFGKRGNVQGSFSPGETTPGNRFGDAKIKIEEYGAVGGTEFSGSGSDNDVSSGTEMESVRHNHTYAIRAENGAAQRPVARDKRSRAPDSTSSGSSSSSESDMHSRDVQRARALNIPISVDDIVNLPMDEFSERLTKYELSDAQLSLIRDIRRRGKNKVAAQNCRKRKMDQILTLAEELQKVRDKKARLVRERDALLDEKQRVKTKFAQLYHHVFESLRDASGRPYSPSDYSLQQSADGSILLVPRRALHGTSPIDPDPLGSSNATGTEIGARRRK